MSNPFLRSLPVVVKQQQQSSSSSRAMSKGASFEQLVLEGAVLSVLIGAPVALSFTLSLNPFKAGIDGFLPEVIANYLFYIIPAMTYLTFRLYCTIVYKITSSIPGPKFIGTLLSFISITGALVGVYFFSGVRADIEQAYSEQFGETPLLLYNHSKKDIVKAYNFGLRIAGTIFGWFIALLVAEKAISFALYLVVYVARLFVSDNSVKRRKMKTSDDVDENREKSE